VKRVAILLAMSAGLALPAAADTISVLRENTLLLKEADGKTYTILIKEGSEMEQVNSAGTWASGVWAIEERGFCWTARGAAKLCIPMPMDKDVGDTWDIKGPTGRHVWTAEIAAGRADLQALTGETPAAEN
jgi:hypothetical protein